jgi:hypothetical protein
VGQVSWLMVPDIVSRADNRWLMFTSVSKLVFRCPSHCGPIEPHQLREVADTVPVRKMAYPEGPGTKADDQSWHQVMES